MYIKKGDNVIILSGKDKGKKSKVISVNRENNTAIVEGINIVHKCVKRRSQEEESRIVEIEAPLNVSKIALVAKDGKATRVGSKIENGKKVRYSKRTGEVL